MLAVAAVLLTACHDDEVEPTPEPAGADTPVLLLGPPRDTVFEAMGVRFNMIYVPAGSFTMGASTTPGSDAYDAMADAIEAPPHTVTLDGFLIGDVEVSQLLYYKVMQSNPSSPFDLLLPLNNLTFSQAEAFLDTLSAATGYRFRMPTEAEWEYAARCAGRDAALYVGGAEVDSVAWWQGNAGEELHGLGLLTPNALGLYDMSGNVMEWCSDWMADYDAAPQTNPQGPSRPSYPSQQRRAVRGGSYQQGKVWQRCTARQFHYPSSQNPEIGLRLVMSVAK